MEIAFHTYNVRFIAINDGYDSLNVKDMDFSGIRKICAILEKEQIMSPSVYVFKRTGNRSGHPDLNNPFRWTQTTVRGMLANQEYCGDTVNFRTYSKSNKLKKRIKNDAENIMVFENTHEAIIS